MVTTSCVLQLRPGASPQSRGYVYTSPREVSSMVTDLPGTPVTPRIYKYIKYKKFYVYSDGTHTHKLHKPHFKYIKHHPQSKNVQTCYDKN